MSDKFEGRLIDVSRRVDLQTPVYEGDTPLHVKWISSGEVNTSEITVTPHIGTHVDFPMHFAFGGENDFPDGLEAFVGICDVVEVKTGNKLVTLADVDLPTDLSPRVLFKCRTDGQGFSSSLVPVLKASDVRLVGSSNDSLDPDDSVEFPFHKAALSDGMCLLENLDLTAVEAGRYFLSAPPLRWTPLEASPVRAYLMKI